MFQYVNLLNRDCIVLVKWGQHGFLDHFIPEKIRTAETETTAPVEESLLPINTATQEETIIIVCDGQLQK